MMCSWQSQDLTRVSQTPAQDLSPYCCVFINISRAGTQVLAGVLSAVSWGSTAVACEWEAGILPTHFWSPCS